MIEGKLVHRKTLSLSSFFLSDCKLRERTRLQQGRLPRSAIGTPQLEQRDLNRTKEDENSKKLLSIYATGANEISAIYNKLWP